MSDTLAALATYPQLVPSANQLALGQALQNAGAQGPSGVAAGSALSPVTSAIQGILGALLSGQGQQGVQQYNAQQQAQRAALIAQLGGSSGLQGASPGTLSQDSDAANAPPAPAPTSMAAPGTPSAYAQASQAGAAASGLPAAVGQSIAQQESNDGATAPSNPMQVLASTAANPGFNTPPISQADLADPSKAVPWAMQYAANRARAAGADPSTPQGAELAAQLYNGGGTQGYAQQVMSRVPPNAFRVAQAGASDAPLMNGAQRAGLPAQMQQASDPVASDYQKMMAVQLQGATSPDPMQQRISEIAGQRAAADRSILQSRQTFVGQTPGGQMLMRDGLGKLSAIGGETRLYGSPATGYINPAGQPVGPSGVGYQPDIKQLPDGSYAQIQPGMGGQAPTVTPIKPPTSPSAGTAVAPAGQGIAPAGLGNALPAAGGFPRPPGAMPAPSQNPYAGITDPQQYATRAQKDTEEAQTTLQADTVAQGKAQTTIQLGQQFLMHNRALEGGPFQTGELEGSNTDLGSLLGNPHVQQIEKIANEMKTNNLPTGIGGRLDIPIVKAVQAAQPGVDKRLSVNEDVIGVQTSLAARLNEQTQSRAAWVGQNRTLAGFDEAWQGYNNNVPAMSYGPDGKVIPNAKITPDGRSTPNIPFQAWASARTNAATGRYVPDAASVPTAAIMQLRQQPQNAAAFDQHFGVPGLAAQLLGQPSVR